VKRAESHDGFVPSQDEEEISEHPLSVTEGHRQKATICTPENRSSPRTKSSGILMWDFLASQTVRNKYLLFKPPNLVCVTADQASYGIVVFWTKCKFPSSPSYFPPHSYTAVDPSSYKKILCSVLFSSLSNSSSHFSKTESSFCQSDHPLIFWHSMCIQTQQLFTNVTSCLPAQPHFWLLSHEYN
jgi:hypothetical protein